MVYLHHVMGWSKITLKWICGKVFQKRKSQYFIGKAMNFSFSLLGVASCQLRKKGFNSNSDS